ncbi:NACHT domain-containing protein [Streptomyces sp. S6]
MLARRDRGTEAAALWLSAISVVVALLPFVLDTLREPTEEPADPSRRQRAADELAEAVGSQWAQEARRRQLQDPGPLDVPWSPVGPPLADHRDGVPLGLPLPAPRDGERHLSRIVRMFRDVPSRRLVVLGGPGSGKTVLAVRFVLDTLHARQSGDPVPVLFALAGWDPRTAGLRTWLAEQLAAEYRPLAAVRNGRTLARELLDAGLVLPVLDGFDELPKDSRGQALRRLNTGLDDGFGVLLTCRYADWEHTVTEQCSDVLTAARVVRLCPLDAATSRSYLESTARWTGRTLPDGAPETVWTPVFGDLSTPLATVLTSPLMVTLARTVYRDASRTPSELTDTARFPSTADIERHLLDALVPASFADTEGRWRPDRAHHWLTCLAKTPSLPGGTWRLGWWELPGVLPPVLRVLGPASLAVLTTAVVLVPLARYGGGVVADWDSPLSTVSNLAGILAGLAFGLALLLPDTAETPQGPRQLARMGLKMTAGATIVAVFIGLLVPPLASSRLGATLTPRPAWFLNGCCFGLALSMLIAVGGLPRRPLPLSLPWAGSPIGPRVVRALGCALVFAGLASYGYFTSVLPAVTCLVTGLLLVLAERLRRGERTAGRYAGPGAVVRGFGRGLVRGFVACTLIGVCGGAVVGCVTGAFAAYEIHHPDGPRPAVGDTVGGWRLGKTSDGHRFVESALPQKAVLLSRTALTSPFAVWEGARISYDEVRGRYEGRVRVWQRDGQWVTMWRGEPRKWRGRPVDAHNLVAALPHAAEIWLVHRRTAIVVRDAVVPLVGFGLLIGTIGGCASGVYRALNTPCDTIRAASPLSTLRTDRAATLARSAVAVVLAGGMCLALISASGRGSTLGTMHTEVWVQVGTNALALSASGRLEAARIWLALTGRAPWRLMAFLKEAHDRGVLRQSGAHYEFRHQRLQERLAAHGTPEPSAMNPRADQSQPA